MIKIVTFKWGDKYSAEHVNVLAYSFYKHVTIPHEFICITDDAQGLHDSITVLPLPKNDTTHTAQKLWLFSKEAEDIIGGRVALCDIDAIVCANFDKILSTAGSFVGWRTNQNYPYQHVYPVYYQGGFYILNTGTFRYVWDDFPHDEYNNDQWWLNIALPNNLPVVTKQDGITKADSYNKSKNREKFCMIQYPANKCKPWIVNGAAQQVWHDMRDQAQNDGWL